jgi:hypothetical protein
MPPALAESLWPDPTARRQPDGAVSLSLVRTVPPQWVDMEALPPWV